MMFKRKEYTVPGYLKVHWIIKGSWKFVKSSYQMGGKKSCRGKYKAEYCHRYEFNNIP